MLALMRSARGTLMRSIHVGVRLVMGWSNIYYVFRESPQIANGSEILKFDNDVKITKGTKITKNDREAQKHRHNMNISAKSL